MLSTVEAEGLVDLYLGDTRRAAHSRLVAYLMRQLAQLFSADTDLWEIVGLCHDLDFFQISGDWKRHGLLTVEWLGDSIPSEAQHAIAAHDHRTGFKADSLLADSLKAADVVAVIDERLGRRLLCALEEDAGLTTLRDHLGDRTYLCDMLDHFLEKHLLSFARIMAIVADAPPQ